MQTPVNISMPPTVEIPALWFQDKELPIPALTLLSGLFQSELTVTWDKAFPDNNYALSYDLWGSALSLGLQVRKMSWTATQAVIRFNSVLAVQLGASTIQVTARWGSKCM